VLPAIMLLLFHIIFQWSQGALAAANPSSGGSASALASAAPDLRRIMTIISYLPIALYAESLRLHSALASSTISNCTVPPPITGCVKDLNWVWHLLPADIISGTDQAIVASLRHGNHFPLVNKTLLDLASITGRHVSPEDCEHLPRPVSVNVSYLTPTKSSTDQISLRMLCILITTAEVVLLGTASGVLFAFGLYIAGILLACLLLNVLLLWLLQMVPKSISLDKRR
jgi:hypothetical protein